MKSRIQHDYDYIYKPHFAELVHVTYEQGVSALEQNSYTRANLLKAFSSSTRKFVFRCYCMLGCLCISKFSIFQYLTSVVQLHGCGIASRLCNVNILRAVFSLYKVSHCSESNGELLNVNN